MKSIMIMCAMVVTVSATAQQTTTGSTTTQTKTYSKNFFSTIGFGVGWQDFSGLNDRVKEFPEYEQLNDVTALLHLGWLKEKNRLISNTQVTLGSTLSGNRDQKSSDVRFIGLGADVGYDLLASDRMMLYPLVGIGYEWYHAKFNRDVSSVDFDDVLGSPVLQNTIKAALFKNDFFTWRAGLGFNILNPKSNNYGIGIQAAYTGSFQDRSWKSSDNLNLNNSPKDRLGRIQVSLILSGKMGAGMGMH
ncbi:hypothetical protein [Pollutibacter soli]|uniref:hypothetical protein n=1 Tax=Pollutibacter soli TaxID=3034157 RepID=UPI0030134390